METHTDKEFLESRRGTVRRYLEETTWGLLLLFTGVLWIVPGVPHPFAAWLIGVGLILLAAKGVAYAQGMRLDTFTTVVAIVALVAGVGEFLAVDVSVIGLALVAFGALLLATPLRRRWSEGHAPA